MKIESRDKHHELEKENDDETTEIHGDLGFSISDISIKTEQHSADFIIDMLRHDEIDMDTPFQRSPDLWKKDVMSRFIESMMLKFPIPPFYFDISYRLDENGNAIQDQPYWQVVDGLQRLSTVRKFITQTDESKRLRLTGLDFFPELENATYDDLPRNLRRNLHSCQFLLFVIYPNTPKQVKHRIFERVNTGGLKLTDQEIRHAINRGKSNEMLRNAVQQGLVENGINVEPGRMRDQELVLRHFAFRLFEHDSYDGSMKFFLDSAMQQLDEIDTAFARKLHRSFVISVSAMIALLGDLAFRKKAGGSINRSLFDSYTVALAELPRRDLSKLIERADMFEEKYLSTLDELDPKNTRYLESITAATARRDNVLRRFEVANDVIQEVLGDD